MTDFSVLSAEQRAVAEILANNDLHDMTMAEIAERVGINERTIYRWKLDDTFIAYKNSIAEKVMDDFVSEAYEILRGIGKNGMTERSKLKALELVLKNRGKLQDVQKVEATVEDRRTNEEIENQIAALERQIADLDK